MSETGVETVEELESTEQTEAVEETEEQTEEVVEIPAWMQEEDEPTSSTDEAGDQDDDDDKGQQVPVQKHIKVKQKLRGKLQEKDDELEKLRKENEQLKAQPVQSTLTPPKRPRSADFGTDDEFEAAQDQYDKDFADFVANTSHQTVTQKQQVEQVRKQVNQAVDNHYDRAADLVEKNSIKPEVYQQADLTVKNLIKNSIDPRLKGQAEDVFNGLINVIGEGSEKVIFAIGRNKSKQAELRDALERDASGMMALSYLSRLAGEYANASNTKASRAPKPATQIEGDEQVSAKDGSYKRKWSKAHKDGDASAALTIKRKARAEGVDTSGW